MNISTLLYSRIGISVRATGKQTLGVKHRQRQRLAALSRFALVPHPYILFQLLLVLFVKETNGNDPRSLSNRCLDGVDDHWLTLVRFRV